MRFASYDTEGFYDEMFEGGGKPRAHGRFLVETIEGLSDGQLLRYKRAAERVLLQMGITFNVYGDSAGAERIFPFDLVPRIVPADEWDRIERGLKQRIHALNAFIDDIYHDQKILKDGVIPRDVILSAASYRQQCHGLNPPCAASGATSPEPTWCATATAAITCSRTICACPPASSYVLENREVLKRIFPGVSSKACRCGRSTSIPAACWRCWNRSRLARHTTRAWCCSRPASTTRLISSTASWRSRWACNWWKAATWWCPAAMSSCAPPRAWSAWTSFTAASTTIFWIPRSSAPIRCWACPG